MARSAFNQQSSIFNRQLRPWLGSLDRGAWIRFFLALAGLALAFGAALVSSVFREWGNLWATAMAATAALLIAGMVALTTVPYLARRVALARVRDALDYDFTREGMVYMGIALVVGVAALNTGNNLLFIVLAAMLAAIIISGVASAGVLRGLELEVTVPQHVFARKEILARLTLHNRRRVFPSYSVHIVPPRPQKPARRWRAESSVFEFPPPRMARQPWVKMPDLALRRISEPAPRQEVFRGSQYFLYLAGRGQLHADVELRFPRRGLYRQESLGLATRFPFSFLRKTRRVPLGREVLVYPSVEPTDEFFEVLPMITGEFEAFVRGRGYDLYRIREYMPEDSARHVDWKATAKSGSLKVREFTREDERKLRIVFDNPRGGAVAEPAYERAVDLAASLAWHFASEDAELAFVAPGFVAAAGDIYDFLRHLALVEPQRQPEGQGSILETLQLTEDYNLIFTGRARGSIPTQLWTCSYFVFIKEL